MAAGIPLDLPTIAGFGCVIAAVALTFWAAGDVRDAFAEEEPGEFGDWPHLSAELRTGRRNSGGVGGNGQSGPSYDARTRHGDAE